jgi:hypothetical protein
VPAGIFVSLIYYVIFAHLNEENPDLHCVVQSGAALCLFPFKRPMIMHII